MGRRYSDKRTPRTLGQIALLVARWLAKGSVAVVLALLLVFGVAYVAMPLPDANADFTTNTSNVYYNDGTTVIGDFAIQNRQSISYDEMPQSIKDAVVAAENRTFWTDPGIDVAGLARAVISVVGPGRSVGGSTITQQYIKVMYLTSERTLIRKFKELVLATKLGAQVPKEQILESYLNTIWFGRGSYGIEAASKAYFNVTAKDLTVQQSAALAAILNNPSTTDPRGGAEARQRLLARYQYVIDGLADMGKITLSKQAEYRQSLPVFPDIKSDSRYGGPKGFLLNMVRDELETKGFTDEQINGGGLTITTTFGAKEQQAIVKAAEDVTNEAAAANREDPADLHAAMVSIDAASGRVLAVYGGPDYVTNSRNWATTKRASASTFKVFTLVAALRNGFSLNTILNGDTWTPPGESVVVRNVGDTQYGPVTLLKATTNSINTAFVDLVTKIPDGPNQVIKAANDFGVATGPGWSAIPRVTLGTAEVSPYEMASAYATFANNGLWVEPHVVKEVRDARGVVIYRAAPETRQVVDAEIAKCVNLATSTVVDDGTGSAVSNLGFAAAGKTGTALMNKHVIASWFVGYTRQIATSVMFVAGDDGAGNLSDYAPPGRSSFVSSVYPTQAWGDYMRIAMRGLPNLEFDKPTDPENQVSLSPTAKPTTTTPTPSVTITATQIPTPVRPTVDVSVPPTSQWTTSRPSWTMPSSFTLPVRT